MDIIELIERYKLDFCRETKSKDVICISMNNYLFKNLKIVTKKGRDILFYSNVLTGYKDLEEYRDVGLKIFMTDGIKWGFMQVPTHDDGYWGYILISGNNPFKSVRKLRERFSDKNIPITPVLHDGILDKIIENSIGYIRNYKKLKAHGIKTARGILLYGPPGNGKTTISKYIKHLADKKGIQCHRMPSQTLSKAYGAGEDLSEYLNYDGITIFDDVDVNLLKRDSGNDVAGGLLTAMDGIENTDQAKVRIFSTNEEIHDIDAAFRRPGRIDINIRIENPNDDHIKQYFVALSDPSLVEYLSDKWTDVVKFCHGMSFAELDLVRTILLTQKFVKYNDYSFDKASEEFDDIRNVELRTKKKIGLA